MILLSNVGKGIHSTKPDTGPLVVASQIPEQKEDLFLTGMDLLYAEKKIEDYLIAYINRYIKREISYD